MQWHLKSFRQLTGDEVYRILRERVNVFVLEQNCLYPEVDGKDPLSHHLYAEEDGQIAAYCRLLPPGVSYDQSSIGRVLVNSEFRGQGLAQELMNRAIAFLGEQWSEADVKIQAQHYLEKFYGSFGFRSVSDVYLEDDIPHVDMVLSRSEKLS
ncbi:GNAT family N-acetyltransferase [Saccharibacillus alkalitolerans]|uniref:GNAT family N-acetyltransferase n=1 Tax=Saccharibacillus alkalitolerans TaxID=2705290 RepID=A0ABX0FAM1_9BACL|nr:GNAT family N-acetyltransferase [Saccharibacillus alkalitolerans]NGZ77440.1 GNAT family N-acetyltransferase [Saccharibacillus alkalitolerans]